ncbi:MAG: zinc-binding dehydrogenase [Bryobacteraceae bacterium]
MGYLFITRPISLDYVRTHQLASVTGSVFGMFTRGQLNVPISRVYPLKNAADSHRDIERRETTGKLLLSISASRAATPKALCNVCLKCARPARDP